jgi:transcriptional regulator of arginine metabolism
MVRILHQPAFPAGVPTARSAGPEIHENFIDTQRGRLYKNTGECIFVETMNTGKTFRHGQILRLVTGDRISNQEELRRRLAAQRLRVTQATLSRDLQELRLVKTHEGYKLEAALPEEPPGLPSLTHALREFLLDIRPAENLLVLKTPPSGAQPLAAAVDGAKFPETAGTVAGDDTVLIITPNRKSRESLQKKIEALVSPPLRGRP